MAFTKPNAQYNVADADSLAVKVAGQMRRQMFDLFMKTCAPAANDIILDVGATSDQSYESSNYFEKWYPHKNKITAVGIDDASFLEEQYPGLSFRQADGCALPFKDGTFDFAHSSAVLEHVGSAERQQKFIAELYRVSRKGVFLTTPNRWFPIEFHTVIPLLHWLPKPAFRAILRKIGQTFLADEENLNLLSANDLRHIAQLQKLNNYRVSSVRLMGWPSNLILHAWRAQPAAPGYNANGL